VLLEVVANGADLGGIVRNVRHGVCGCCSILRSVEQSGISMRLELIIYEYDSNMTTYEYNITCSDAGGAL
jgi:hypothetical protein